MLWRATSGCSNYKKNLSEDACTFHAKDDGSGKYPVAVLHYGLLRQLSGPSKTDFSLQDCRRKVMSRGRCRRLLFWRADVKACYLSLMFETAAGFCLLAFNSSCIPATSRRDVMLSTATGRRKKEWEMHHRSPQKWHSDQQRWPGHQPLTPTPRTQDVTLTVTFWPTWTPQTCRVQREKMKKKNLQSRLCSSIKQSIW